MEQSLAQSGQSPLLLESMYNNISKHLIDEWEASISKSLEYQGLQWHESSLNLLIAQGFSRQEFLDFILKSACDVDGQWPLAILPSNRAQELGFTASARIVRLSSQSVDHGDHRLRWLKFVHADWCQIQRMLCEARWIEDRPKHRVFWCKNGKKYWKLVIKYTSLNEIFLSTYLEIRDRQARALDEKWNAGLGGAAHAPSRLK